MTPTKQRKIPNASVRTTLLCIRARFENCTKPKEFPTRKFLGLGCVYSTIRHHKLCKKKLAKIRHGVYPIFCVNTEIRCK